MTSFLPDFGLSDSDDMPAPPDDEVHLHTVKDTAPCTNPEMIGNIGPTAAFSLQALLNNSFKMIFGVASAYGADDILMHLRHLFSEGVRVVDRSLMEIKDKKSRHQSASDGLTPLSIAEKIEQSALPI
jgi:hypothetical protein